MTKVVTIAITLLAIICPVKAQNVWNNADVDIWRYADSVRLDMQIPTGELMPGRQEVIILTPRLVCGDNTADFPSVLIYGKQPYQRHIRGGRDWLAGEHDIILPDKYCPPLFQYQQETAYQPWMERAELRLTVTTVACGGNSDERLVFSKPVAQERVIPGKPRLENRSHEQGGHADITFQTNRTEILPDYRDNSRELAKIQASLDSVRNDTAAHMQRMTLHGYASPEGPYENNERLARERTESLKRYIAQTHQLPDSLIHTAYTAEDWEGLRAYVAAYSGDRQLPHAAQILGIIDNQEEPDAKLGAIRRLYPAEYRHLLENCFPSLRRSDYNIRYSRREWTERPGETDTVYTFPVGEGAAPRLYPTYPGSRPLFALKSNLLYDVALAPNVELEVPLGRESRWSVMAEYWIPWYVWHYNTRAFEVQTLGFEIRRWTNGRCGLFRPMLTGNFWGVYCQTGKYDVEWSSKGYQGEFTSAGITFGHSWMLGRYWNLEVSGSIGAIWGPQRYYEGMFEDTHLIWLHDDHLFYAGPTKLKVSLAFLVPNVFKKKGGRR